MSITVFCEGCTKSLRVKDTLAGKRCKCPRCGQIVVIPQLQTVPAEDVYGVAEEAHSSLADAAAPADLAPSAHRSSSASGAVAEMRPRPPFSRPVRIMLIFWTAGMMLYFFKWLEWLPCPNCQGRMKKTGPPLKRTAIFEIVFGACLAPVIIGVFILIAGIYHLVQFSESYSEWTCKSCSTSMPRTPRWYDIM